MRKLESLEAWKYARELSVVTYRLTLDRRLRQHFALTDQIRRSAISIPANIAEGYALSTTPQFLRYLRIALGSATELHTHLHVLASVEVMPAEQTADAASRCDRVIGLLIGLIRSLQ